jgi:general secretion pathway protein A
VAHRLDTAGGGGRIVFEPKAIRGVYRYSGGIPRLINAVCDNALLAGYVAGTWRIDAACIKRAIAQLEGSS